MRKRLLLLLLTPPPYGGGELRGLRMAEYFRGRPDIRVVAFSRSWATKFTQGRVSVRNVLYGLYYLARASAHMLVCRPGKIFFSIPKNMGAFLRMVPLIHLARILGADVCGELAGARFEFLEAGGWKKRVGLFYLRKFYSIRFLGNSVARRHAEYGFSNPIVFSNSADHPHPKTVADATPDTGKLECLFVGELSRSKGVERIVCALERCRQEGLDVAWTLVGEWKDEAFKREMTDRIRRGGLQESARFTGLLKNDEKWERYDRAQVLTHPTDLDGQPVAILEAMGSGLAVVSTRIGAIPDTIEDGVNGLILPAITGEDLFAAVRKLYHDRPLLRRIRERNVDAYRENYSQDQDMRNMERWLLGCD